ncbi:MAG: excinuclease ABC subunit UvrC [Patescibacteria group bacterium]
MNQSSFYKTLPETPGVYLMKDRTKKLLYVGKAGNLRRRVSSYFTRPHDSRIQTLVENIHSIDHQKTDTAIEALLLEAKLIKKYEPPFNIREKDDKSFLCVGITRELFPRVLLVRGKDREAGDVVWRRMFGPFTSASHIREALRIIRKIFPFHTHDSVGLKKQKACFDYQIGLCPGVCVGAVSRADYLKNIRNIILFFDGEKKKILRNLKKERQEASRGLEYERAEKLQRQIFALEHIQDVALITEPDFVSESETSQLRIEGYDISNISGTAAVGSMVVFINGKSAKSEYRKFNIKTVSGANDVGMLREVLERRFNNPWPLPQLILMDGGVSQVNVARRVVSRLRLFIPVVGLAKGPERKRNDLIGVLPKDVVFKTVVAVRDEAHRFAIKYHKSLRSRRFLSS